MASLNKEKPLDVEAYQRLLVTARSVAVSRPNNLIKFAEKGNKEDEGNQLLNLIFLYKAYQMYYGLYLTCFLIAF